MSTYLIDYENTQNLLGIENLTETDVVIIFYSKNANTLNFPTHIALKQAKATIAYKNVEVGGNNALDFQLSSYLGFLINQNLQNTYYIISKDKGYKNLVSFWKKEANVEIKVVANLTGNLIPEEVSTDKPQTEAQNNSANLENDLKISSLKLEQTQIKKVCEIVKQYKQVSTINNNLQKHFKDNAKVKEIMKILKPYLKDKKGSI